MSFLPGNPLSVQGNLNRVLTHVVVADFPALSITAPYMAKGQATLTFDDDFVEQIKTATGVVNSPQPFAMADLVVNMLRTQPACNLWIAQAQVSAILGTIDVYSDSSSFQKLTLIDCSLMRPEPGPFDGTDPTVKMTVKGVFYINSVMWA